MSCVGPILNLNSREDGEWKPPATTPDVVYPLIAAPYRSPVFNLSLPSLPRSNDHDEECPQSDHIPNNTHTLPPSSFALTVTITDPIVTSEMTNENT